MNNLNINTQQTMFDACTTFGLLAKCSGDPYLYVLVVELMPSVQAELALIYLQFELLS